MTDFLVKNLFTIVSSIFTIGGAYGYIRYKVSEIDSVKGEVKKMAEIVAGLQTFHAVQLTENTHQKERNDEVISWLKSLDQKIDTLLQRNKN